MSLASSALLVSLTVKQWSARKYDKSASEQVCITNEAKRGSGNFNKQLINKDDLKAIQRVVNAARNYHYQNTLAWDHDGADLLPAKHYTTYVAKMSEYKEEFEKEVNAFIKLYPSLLTKVMNDLNKLYNPKDYPSQEKLKSKFSMNLIFTPIPDAGDFRVDISDKENKKLKEQLDNRLALANASAEKDLYMRLYTTIAKAVIVLNTPDKIFRNSLILNILELVQKIPNLNFNDSIELNTISDNLNDQISLIDIDELRNEENPTYRKDIAKELSDELKNIESIYNAKWDDLNEE